MNRPLGLAAQAVPGVTPWDLVEIAAAAGFDRVGLAIDPLAWDAGCTHRVRTTLAATGVVLQDVEVIRLEDCITDATRCLLDIAIELEAHAVITIALGDNAAETQALLAALVEHCAGSVTVPILEFGRFTGVISLAQALAIAVPVGVPVLADPLHLARAGDSFTALSTLPTCVLPYAQLCDAGPPPLRLDRATLLAEARDDRRNIGDGMLDLAAFVAALPPATPLMNEVRLRAIDAAWPDPLEHARMLAATMRAWVAQLAVAA